MNFKINVVTNYLCPENLSFKHLLVFPTLICSTAMILSGCQSVKQDDANIFPAQNQLLNDSGQRSVSQNSKALFLSSLDAHLKQDHTAVSQLQYRLVPYIDKDDIESGDSSFGHTLLELKRYQELKEYEELEEDDEYEAYEELVEDDEYEAYEEAYEEDYNDYNSKSGLNKFNPFDVDLYTLLEDYKDIKQSDKQDASANANYYGMAQLFNPTSFLDMLKQTPEQVDAYNYYGAEPLTITAVSRYQPQQQRFQALYNLDYNATTYKTSIQLPVELDFNKSLISFDPVLAIPFVTRFSKEDVPLAEDIEGKTVTFDWSRFTQTFPIGQVQQSLLTATQQALTSLSAEHFTEINLNDDTYANHIGAARGVKIYLGSKQHGELAGRIIKLFTQDMQNYVRAHPQDFSEEHIVKNLLGGLELYNQGYQSKDMGSLFQIIEAVLPINWDSFNYFYYDANGTLIGKQNRSEVESYLTGMRYNLVQQTRYDSHAFSNSPLARKLVSTFDTHRNTIDGNAWMEDITRKDAYKDTARYTRYDYDTPYNNDDTEYDYLDEVESAVYDADAEAMAIAAAEEVWEQEGSSNDDVVEAEAYIEAELYENNNLDSDSDSDLVFEDENTETLSINISKKYIQLADPAIEVE